MLKVVEIFHSLAGEGSKAGQAMTFIRLTGCNLRCRFCDSTYAYEQGTEMSEADIVERCMESGIPWVCLTGGEPLIQDVTLLLYRLHEKGFQVAVETNGTQPIPDMIDHVVVSPKRDVQLHVSTYSTASEWKYIIQDESDFERISQESGVFLQPVDNDLDIARLCAARILENPGWRLSLQIHKILGIK